MQISSSDLGELLLVSYADNLVIGDSGYSRDRLNIVPQVHIWYELRLIVGPETLGCV